MKLLRFGPAGQERPGILDEGGRIRDASLIVPDFDAPAIAEALQLLRGVSPTSLPIVAGDERIGPPLRGVGKIVCVGLNYVDHARETGQASPTEPILFLKATSSIVGPNDDIVLPPGAQKCDWEVELGVVIGQKARYVDKADALKHVAGYCVVNDVSEREYQLERGGGQWDKGKGCDTFGPVGPWLVTAEEIKDPQDLAMWLDVNGQRRQNGTTATMIFGVAELVAYCSRFMTLWPGDLISTGTPPGVGMGMKPPTFLNAGDEVRLGIAGLGEQRQKIHAWDPKLIDD